VSLPFDKAVRRHGSCCDEAATALDGIVKGESPPPTGGASHQQKSRAVAAGQSRQSMKRRAVWGQDVMRPRHGSQAVVHGSVDAAHTAAALPGAPHSNSHRRPARDAVGHVHVAARGVVLSDAHEAARHVATSLIHRRRPQMLLLLWRPAAHVAAPPSSRGNGSSSSRRRSITMVPQVLALTPADWDVLE